MLDELLRDERIPPPLFLDSLSSRASDVYLRHPEVYDEETAAALLGRLAAGVPGRAAHQHGRRVEGDPRLPRRSIMSWPAPAC